MFLSVLTALSVVTSGQNDLNARLDQILDTPKLKGALVGVCIGRENGELVYERNADLRMMPASNQKLLSVSFALHVLGPEWRPKTRFWKEPDRLVIDCPGDPSLTYAKLKEISAKLALSPGIPIFVRQGYRQGVPPTWENDDLPNRYAPRITGLTVDRGSFALANDDGSPKFIPNAYGVRIMHFPFGRARNEFDPFGNLLVVHGDLPKEKKNLENFAIPEPDRAAASILSGPLFEATSLPDRKPDLEVEGDRVSKMAADCLPPSDNYLAECLMLLAAAKEGDLSDAPYEKGPARMRSFLQKVVGLSPEESRPVDGSGMSRHNLVTPRALVKVLNWAKKQPWAKLWQDALAHAGKSGTLSARLKESSFIGKTGSLSSVSSLSGYVKGTNGENWTVSIFLNHFLCTQAEAHTIQDAVVREIEKPVSLLTIPVSDGPDFEGRIDHASRCPLPRHSSAHVDRILRSLHDGLAARQRPGRRIESDHAAPDRAERVAFRFR